ncbi:MAG TPA: alkaline phosphatase family protein [Gemmatimonadaceae bacterium]|nr:alkaline phosphatase family protein [Gemmatimonadaceae bacterium]
MPKIASILLLLHVHSLAAQSVPRDRRPNLVIVISVDMLSGEIMDRYTGGLTGGLGQLLAEGVVFENAYQEHAFTETCPGHATLLSGRYPASTGIGTNSWIDSGTSKQTYCVEDDRNRTIGMASGTPGASDAHFIGTTFGTWLKDEIPGSRVFAVAGKDRSAILMAGPKTDGVYWFQEGFGFTTSTAYADTIPPWLTQFNARLMYRLRTQTLTWIPVGPSDGLTYPGEWKADLTGYPIVSRLPRLIGTQGFPEMAKSGFVLNETQDGGFWNRYRASPFWDDAIFGAAEALIDHEHLGEGKHIDLLCLGLSATNAAEHAYGNAGPEMQDLIRRLDARLGVFLSRLRRRGTRVVVVLSADHGGLDFAERLRSQGIPARRIDTQAWTKELNVRVRRELGASTDLVSGGDQQIYVDHAAAAAVGNLSDVIERITAIVRTMPEVAAAASLVELRAMPSQRFLDPRDEDVLYRLKLSAAERRSADILFAFNPLVERDGPPKHDPAQHGTPWDYDRRVPLIFMGPWRAEHRTDPASTVDIAPTLADALGIRPEQAVDGRPLRLAPTRVSRSAAR